MRLLICLLSFLFLLVSCRPLQVTTSWKIPVCGIFQHYPIYLEHKLPTHPDPQKLKHYPSQRNNIDTTIHVPSKFQVAKDAWNLWGARHHFHIFTTIQHSNTPVVQVRAAEASSYKAGKRCSLYQYHNSSHVDSMAWTEYRLHGAIIFVCVEKYAHAVRFAKSSLARHLRRFGLEGYIMHELGHVIIGPYHLDDSGLMSSSPSHRTITEPISNFIQTKIIATCRKRNE